MVLCMLGILGLLFIGADKLSSITRESLVVTLFFKENVSDEQVLAFQKKLEKEEYVRATKFISKEDAAEEFQKELGEDFLDFLGYNPLPAAIDVNFKPEYAEQSFFEALEKKWMTDPKIERVDYPANLVEKIVSNMRKIGWVFLAIAALLTFISITLINNTIRLAIYSRRFLIRTMQLVGATRQYIRRPFLLASLLQGFIGGVLALLILGALLYFGERQLPELKEIRDVRLLGILAGAVLGAGVFLSFICTFFAVRKYLHLKSDSLY